MADTPTGSTRRTGSSSSVNLNEEDLASVVRRVYEAMNRQPNTSASRSSNASETVEDELSRRFQTPRSRQSGTLTTLVPNQLPYNPLVNYGHQGKGKGKGKGKAPACKKASESQVTLKELILLPTPGYDVVPRYTRKRALQERGMIIDGFPLDKNWDDIQLQLKIGSALADVLEDDDGNIVALEFVKTIGQSICPLNLFGERKEPRASELAGLCRQGPIYVRARKKLKLWNESREDEENGDDENEDAIKVTQGPSGMQGVDAVTPTLDLDDNSDDWNTPGQSGLQSEVNDDINPQRPSCTGSSIDKFLLIQNVTQSSACSVKHLEMFPVVGRQHLKEVLETNEMDVIHAVTDLLKETECDETLDALLNELGSKIYGEVVKMKVDEDDILNDALAMYKHPEFDPTTPVRVIFRGQPAVDVGGVKRQFFTELLHKMACSTELKLFEGPEISKSPSYNSSVISSGLLKLFGSMVAHAIVHAKVGLPILSQSFFWYVATGDVNKAIPYASLDDIYDEEVKHYIGEAVSLKNEDYCKHLNSDVKFVEILSNSGIPSQISLDHKLNIIQSIIIHYAINKRKVCMDQFRDGLRTLDVLKSIEKYPEVWEPLFVSTDDSISADEIKSVLKPPAIMTESQAIVWEYLNRYVDSCPVSDLKRLLKFVTGAEYLLSSEAKSKGIKVSFDASHGCIFASTCSLSLQLPSNFISYEEFAEAMVAVSTDVLCRSFNTI